MFPQGSNDPCNECKQRRRVQCLLEILLRENIKRPPFLGQPIECPHVETTFFFQVHVTYNKYSYKENYTNDTYITNSIQVFNNAVFLEYATVELASEKKIA